MEKAFKYRIYPNLKQRILIAKTFGCTRFVFNYFLDKRIKVYEQDKITLNYCDNAKDLVELKEKNKWLKEVDSTALQSSLKDLQNSFNKFFREHNGYPKFKSKKTHSFSYTSKFTANNIEYLGTKIKLPKLGLVKTKNKLIPKGRILSATVSQTPDGKYYVSLCCTNVEIEEYEKNGQTIGVDLGIKDFAITSDGIKISNPKYLNKSLKKLAKLQRSLSRKTKGGKNWVKVRIKAARLNKYIANQRLDFLHKTSSYFIKNYDVICLESLKVSNMIKNHKLALNIADVSWSEFVCQLEYKAKWYGKTISKVGTFFPSSQVCNKCGQQNSAIKDLSIRKWICPSCNAMHDRDINSAINIKNEGLRLLNL